MRCCIFITDVILCVMDVQYMGGADALFVLRYIAAYSCLLPLSQVASQLVAINGLSPTEEPVLEAS